MAENGALGRGRGRAALMARLTGQNEPAGEPQPIGRGALLRGTTSPEAAPTPPPSIPEPKPTGRGALLQQLAASLPEGRTVPRSPPEQHADVVPPRQSPPSASTESVRTGGRGRANLLQIIKDKNTNGSRNTNEVTEAVSELSVSQRSPPRSREPQERSEPVRKHGTSGRVVPATANYIKLELRDPTKGIYEYEVNFEPSVDDRRQRMFIVNDQFKKHAPIKIFDGGAILYSPHRLDRDIVREKSTLRSGMEVDVIFKYKRMKPLSDCRHILNIIIKRVMGELNLIKFGRSDYNPAKMIKIQQHKLSIWPGCETAVEEYEGGIHLCLDASHRVLRDQRCIDIIRDIIQQQRGGEGVKNAITTAFIGTSVITTYNNKVYKIDDVDFEVNPLSPFDKNGEPVTYMDYYKAQYNLTIQDKSQPMLVHRVKRKPIGKENVDVLLYLVPELCCPTGLTDDMRNNHKLMKDVAEFTRCSPNQRQAALREFVKGIKENPKAAAHLNNWGLILPDVTIDDEARVLNPETIQFGGNRTVVEPSADWNRALSSNAVLSPIDLRNWAVIHTARDTPYSQNFLETAKQISMKIGISINKPIIRSIPNDQARTYCEEIRRLVQENVQIVVTIFPTNRDDRYAMVKKLCYAELGIANQVINSKTLSKPNALRSIVVKIMLQINCKIGGFLWGVPLPYKEDGIMFCGIDAYHEALKKTQSVVALVSSLNTASTRWTSAHAFHHRGQEISDVITGLLKKNLQQWYKKNNSFPARIVVYRDGVGDGQLKTVRDFEVPQFERMFPVVSADYNPKLTYVIVQKRISARIYARERGGFGNPPPGTIMDHTITRRDWYDYFLVSQNVRQGTVSPTHYVVVKDTSEMTPDQVQRLSYKMTHLYYNWSGTVRVPAPCQYAHKLAYLIGQHVHAPAKENLSDLLFFL
ncbi:piwi-like protein Ago3 [Planococcus citri]|uniref:piwi-like protein Ago3 n=1 Tax=Planococcus citri TaxID=170843 RepID=UPI0031F7DAF8